ncbi:MAG TPA: PAS domain S-box protein [Candidatus Acidoferrum sp.]|jgi:PAS domain S-box-containing protein
MEPLNENLYRSILEIVPNGICAVDRECKIIFWNETTEKVTGHLRQDVLGPVTATYTNWELSADREKAARRFMEQAGLHPGQVTQIRGFADRRLRKSEDPLDPSNRGISLIVQYESKTDSGAEPAEEGTSRGNGEGGGAGEPKHGPGSASEAKIRAQKRVTAH